MTTNGGNGDIKFGTINKAAVPIHLDVDYESNIAFAEDELVQVVNDSMERADAAKKIGNVVGRQWDFYLHLKILQGALATARVQRMDNGSMVDIEVGTAETKDNVTGEELKEAIFKLKAMYESKNVMDYMRWLLIDPTDYSKLAQLNVLLDVDLGGVGNISQGTMKQVAGFKLQMSNVMPNANYASDTKIETLPFAYTNQGRVETLANLSNNYLVDGTNTIALGYDKRSVATAIWTPMVIRTSGNYDVNIIKKKWYASCFQRSGSQYMMESTCGGIRACLLYTSPSPRDS